ncbi:MULTISPECIES: LysR substrate-binding domain-containing protein [Neobacillus]|uniref:LysR family transcriptional regulator n=1 Tax=Neobacillus rhizophilus TaxID=2833579 RepID=A0A942U522_9BACI|nr:MULTISPECIES: LysR substrate-binding domain-containing protein [Neobacillus]MBS4214851.1 LysR family transcriptional regulator [Neobacillus rhizophilus]MBU8918915.1 LysR family transcriptional regulator [Bacillus sp. FJAT-29953]
MDIEQMYRIFLTLSKDKNFSKVAEKLHISQPAVSQHIKNLEKLYNVPLFIRSKNISLTPAGETLVTYVEKILSLYDESFLATQEQQTSNNPIKVGTSLTIGTYFLPRIISQCKKQMIENVIQVKVGRTKEVIQRLLHDEIDVGLVVEEIKMNSLIEESFAEDEIVLILSPDHPWAQDDELGIKELLEANFIIMEIGSHKLAENTLRQLGIEFTPSNSMEIGDTEAMKRTVENGLGVGILFYSAVKSEVQKGTLKVMRISGHKMVQKFYWVTKPTLCANKNVDMFKEIIFSKNTHVASVEKN